MNIIQSRLEGVPGNLIDSDAIQFASRKVAAVSGDARRVLDICRRAVEIAESQSSNGSLADATPSRRDKSVHRALDGSESSNGRVVIGTIKQAISEATSSPLQQCLKALPLASKFFLAAILTRIRRSGVAECILGDIIDEAKQLSRTVEEPMIRETLVLHSTSWTTASENEHQAIPGPRVQAVGGAAFQLMECGIIALEPKKGDRTGKVRLSINEEEIKLALRDDIEVRGLGFSM